MHSPPQGGCVLVGAWFAGVVGDNKSMKTKTSTITKKFHEIQVELSPSRHVTLGKFECKDALDGHYIRLLDPETEEQLLLVRISGEIEALWNDVDYIVIEDEKYAVCAATTETADTLSQNVSAEDGSFLTAEDDEGEDDEEEEIEVNVSEDERRFLEDRVIFDTFGRLNFRMFGILLASSRPSMVYIDPRRTDATPRQFLKLKQYGYIRKGGMRRSPERWGPTRFGLRAIQYVRDNHFEQYEKLIPILHKGPKAILP